MPFMELLTLPLTACITTELFCILLKQMMCSSSKIANKV